MSEPCEFELVPMKRAVRDVVAQLENHTSKSEASMQKVTALKVGETNSLTDRLEAGHQRERKDVRYFWATRTSSRRRLQYQEEEEIRKCWNEANLCFSTAVLFKLQDWYSTDHGSHTPQQDDGSGKWLQLPYVHTDRNRQLSVVSDRDSNEQSKSKARATSNTKFRED